MTTLIVDVSGLYHRCFFAAEGTDERFKHRADGLPIAGVRIFTSVLMDLMHGGFWDRRSPAAPIKIQPNYVAMACDHPAKGWRSEIFEGYKAQRPPKPDDLQRQIPYFRKAIEAFGLSCIEVEGFEADDVIATICRMAMESGDNAIIHSGDKDLAQCVNSLISIYQPGMGTEGFRGHRPEKWYDPVGVDAKFGVSPFMMPDYQALCGDSVDNVPGMPGCGPKNAKEMLNAYYSVEGIIANRTSLKPKFAAWLAEDANRNTLRLSRQLVTLMNDVPLEISWQDMARPILDPQALHAFMIEMGFVSLRRRVEAAFNLEPWNANDESDA